MRQCVTFEEIGILVSAKASLWLASLWLWRARIEGHSQGNLRQCEETVKKALDRLWEAQQRAA
jgi:hypothetical protein